MPVTTPAITMRAFAESFNKLNCACYFLFFDLKERDAEMDTPLRKGHETSLRKHDDAPLHKNDETPLRGVRPNIVQSIRAFRVQELQDAATQLNQHFLYANLGNAQSKQDVLDMIAAQYTFPAHFGKNFDALYDCMTDLVHK